MRTKLVIPAICLLLLSIPPARLAAQVATPESEAVPLPTGFEGLSLGLELDELKEALQRSGYFYYRGDPDVSLLERENRTLLEAEGAGYVASGEFQFTDEERLFVIVLNMDPDLIDYFSLYTTFVEKYGEPDDLSPERAIWEDEQVRISLERPVSVRYIDQRSFSELLEEREALKSYERIGREEFLSRF